MIRIKIRLHNGQAKVLRFQPGIPFEDLTMMVAKKLGVAPQDDVSGEEATFRLYLGGDALVEETSEIDNGDVLVLRIVGSENANVETKQEKPSDTVAIKTEKESMESQVVDPYAYNDMRVAKFIAVEGQKDKVLFFGSVKEFHPNSGEWEIEFDDGDVEYRSLEDFETLEMCIERASENRHLDGKSEQKDADSNAKAADNSDGDSSDEDTIEDVTDKILSEKKKQRENETIHVESDSDEEDADTESEVDSVAKNDSGTDSKTEDDESETEARSAFDRLFDSIVSDTNDEKKRKAKGSSKQRKKRACKPKDPPLEVLMSDKDVPVAPGKRIDSQGDAADKDGLQEASTLTGGTSGDDVVKQRIMKLLNTGFHSNSNEHEAKNAMKLAQRLMRKHNLSQAVLLKERDCMGQNGDNEVLKGGLVKIRIVNRKTKKPSQFARWLERLMLPVEKNFDVKSYYEVSRGRWCTVTFYGIYTNCQLAGYAFRVAAERISQMAAEHMPVKRPWRNISTKSSRLSYALGIVAGIDDEVDATIQREKERRERKLERARLAASKGEAYEESDDEDEVDKSDGPGFSMGGNDNPGSSTFASVPTGTKEEDHDESQDSDKDRKQPAHGDVCDSTQQPPETTSHSLSGDALSRRLKKMEDEQNGALVLVNHQEKIAKEVLKENDIELSKGRKEKPISFDGSSYRKGVEDSKEIDINQRAIRDEVKVKTEKE